MATDKTMFTIRYHPMCHLPEALRKYVVNARYVLFDPWEWDYQTAGMSEQDHTNAAISIGNSVAIQGSPCIDCGLYTHCGGWNRIYAAGFDGADLVAVVSPEHTQYMGYLHDQNPANGERGFF
jgi:hypothetical protein